mgnify:FL=1
MTSPAGSTVTVTAELKDESVNVIVEDEGPGIPVGMREKVFEKFVRLDGERTEGLGLGLAIVRGIVEAQNGTIKVGESESGGAKVTMTLPVD